jgi:hypothetical protein
MPLEMAFSAIAADLMTCPAPISGEASARNTSLIGCKGMLSLARFLVTSQPKENDVNLG